MLRCHLDTAHPDAAHDNAAPPRRAALAPRHARPAAAEPRRRAVCPRRSVPARDITRRTVPRVANQRQRAHARAHAGARVRVRAHTRRRFAPRAPLSWRLSLVADPPIEPRVGRVPPATQLLVELTHRRTVAGGSLRPRLWGRLWGRSRALRRFVGVGLAEPAFGRLVAAPARDGRITGVCPNPAVIVAVLRKSSSSFSSSCRPVFRWRGVVLTCASVRSTFLLRHDPVAGCCRTRRFRRRRSRDSFRAFALRAPHLDSGLAQPAVAVLAAGLVLATHAGTWRWVGPQDW